MFCNYKSFAQGGVWTWMHGDTANNISVYGAPGQFDPSYRPAFYYERCSWKDKQGKFWYMAMGDSLWKFDPMIQQWAFIRGSGVGAIYGVKGIPNPLNTPGARSLTTLTWADTTGNLWLFGGLYAQIYSDLWKFDVNTLEWTWVSGSNLPNDYGYFGVQGIPSIINYPSARSETNISWVDSSTNNLWCFGGLLANTSQSSHDLWKYDIATNEWTWMKGDTIFSNPVFGTKGIPDPVNSPGSRAAHAKWTSNNGNFWLHGGQRFWPPTEFNDVWKYDISNNCWTWSNGYNNTNIGFASGNCSEDTSNVPPVVFENKFNWKDKCGNFWMLSLKNLMWEFSPVSETWNLTGGTYNLTMPIHYGIKGIPDPANHPGISGGSETWTDNTGIFWYIDRVSGTMWKFEPDTNCSGCNLALPVALFSSDNTIICPGSCTDFINHCINASSYQWTFAGGTPGSSYSINPQNICYANPGSYDVQLIALNSNGSDTLLFPGYIVVLPSPSSQGITQAGDTLFANTGSAFYQWYYNGNLIPGATNYFYVATMNGDYNVIATDSNGCEAEAVIFNVLTSIYSGITPENNIHIYPHPAGNSVYIKFDQEVESASISLFNFQGKMVIDKVQMNSSHKNSSEIDLSMISSGMYFVEISISEKIFRTKLVKE